MTNLLYDHLLGQRCGSEQTFLTLEDDNEISYRQFDQQVNRFANALVDSGLGVGDRVAAQVNKSWMALALYLGTVKAGGVFLPLNNAYTPAEIQYFVDNAEPRIVVCDQDVFGLLEGIAARAGARLLTLDQDGSGSLADLAATCATAFHAVPREPDDLAAILYTSGTTGRAKGAMLSHRNLVSNTDVLVDVWGFTGDDVLLHALPVFHTHGLFVATNIALASGGKMIFLNTFDTTRVIDRLPRATTMMGVPTFYTRLLDDPAFSREVAQHMRLFISGSAPLLAETHRAFEQRTGQQILERYGMTETNMNTSNPLHGDRRAGTVGPALPGVDLRVVDTATGQPLTGGEIGSVQVRGDNVFQGYWGMPEKTAEEFTEDGFFITGDLGRLSSDRYLTIVGRDKDLIITGGYNVYPREIELVLDALDGVRESAVIGVAHADFGEGIVAVLTGDQPPNAQQVRDQIKGKLAGFKQPKKIRYLDQLPRNAMGKVQKNLLRQQFSDIFQYVKA